jgi:menaquinol-cytochrome c reductase iron-sulfur subunit
MNESRRSFLNKATQGILGAGFLAGIWPYLRSLIPNVFYEPPKRFKVGNPADFIQGMTFLEDNRVYIFREGSAFYCISAVCSHLGCTVKYSPLRNEKDVTIRGIDVKAKGEFHCPCHGSKFHSEGTNYSGPAPRPLNWYRLEVSPEDGQLMVNVSRKVDRTFRLVV